MSTGLFMGIRSSFAEEAQDAASTFINAINEALMNRGLPPYYDPVEPPNVYIGHLFGRSELDHHSSRVLEHIAALSASEREAPNLSLIVSNPFRVAFLPIDFPFALQTKYSEQIGTELVGISAGSLPCLQLELNYLASQLGIPLKNGYLADEIAAAINNFEPLSESDSTELIEDDRTAWLVLYEGVRLAIEHTVALSLAG